MRRLRQNDFQCKCPSSERFAANLPPFLTLLEAEWRDAIWFMSTEERLWFRMAHMALGRLNELQDGAP